MNSLYRIKIDHLSNGQCALKVARKGSVLMSWSGETARRLISWAQLSDGDQPSKHRVRELAVAGAAVSRAEGLTARCVVEKAVTERRGTHLSEDELVGICVSERLSLPDDTVRATLLELSRQNRIQRIVVEDNLVFYDADTTAHLHIFDPESKRLYDAPKSGVVVGTAN